ncbi:Tim44/TimA family putative adaptor protein [Novosphingobium sp. MW5]|nr:Tim44/TimA family putative adaptor protein [Novosphingobium sp. MW5]
MTVQIVILALIAAFPGLRLYSVLGRRAEHEEETISGRVDAGSDAKLSQVPLPKGLPVPAGAQREIPGVLAPAERALREIAAADRRFDLLTFLAGAEGAYRMALEAYWRGDKEELSHLCDADVYEGFASAIDARAASGEVLDNRLVRIEEAVVVEASYNAPIARITVRFTSDIAAVTRDAKGNVIAGSLTDAVEAKDVWTFSRNVKSAGPDWLIDETDED